MKKDYDWTLLAWALDFVIAIEAMPKWKRLLLRIVLDRYAAREYVGLREHLVETNYVDAGYDLERAKYHLENWKWLR